MAAFERLGLDPWLVRQCTALHHTEPTEVQRAAIPALLREKKHIVGGAATGSGKTAAFALPILQELAAEVYGVFALVLTPSRELAYQIVDQFVAFGAPLAVRTALLIGGVPHNAQIDEMRARPHIVVATPGRAKFLFEGFSEVMQALRHLRFLVLDEADRLTDGDIREDTLAVVRALGTPKPARRTLLFTATVNQDLTEVDRGLLLHFGVSEQSDLAVCACDSAMLQAEGTAQRLPAQLEQRYLFVPAHVKLQYLVCLLRSRDKAQSAIIFVNSCMRCEVVRLALQLLGFPVSSLNSLLTQQQRLNALAMFKAGLSKFLVATDIAARGLDIPDVDLVVHYDFPKLTSTYVHRVGRTARAGRAGAAVALVSENDVYLVHKVERRIKARLDLYKHPAVSEKAVLEILDDVGSAKVEAKLAATKAVGEKAAHLKTVAGERRGEINRAIREDGARRGKTARPEATVEEAPKPRRAPRAQ